MRRYFGEFKSVDDVVSNFCIGQGELSDDEVLFAAYESRGYEGYCVVLFRRNCKLYFVEASHCSCYGLEHQWKPDEVVPYQLLPYKISCRHKFCRDSNDWYDEIGLCELTWKELVESLINVQ